MSRFLAVEQACHWSGPVEKSAVIVDACAYYAAFYRAASLARRHILLAGWQFDTTVKLLRGPAARAARYPVELLAFLDALCSERPELSVRVLAWDYSLVYTLEREWLQQLKFAFQSASSVHFEFDAHPELGASHHQKFAVIDGVLAFAGGLDICEERWDDRRHVTPNPLRLNAAGQPCRPNHEVQALVGGKAATALLRLFEQRWFDAVGQQLVLEPVPSPALGSLDVAELDRSAILPLRASRVSMARTLPASWAAPPVYEVRAAFCAAIAAAERLIYIETQYFTSRSLRSALLARLADQRRPKLQIVALMPRGADNSKEKFALGDLQAAMLSDVQEAAEAFGHELRCLCSAVAGDDCEAATFIHSKVLIVDDELLCVGSANVTERSLTLDSELCLFWRAEPSSALSEDIAEVRASLLAEHSGQPIGELRATDGLIERIDRGIAAGASRLRVNRFEHADVNPLKLAIFDPSAPDAAEPVEEPP